MDITVQIPARKIADLFVSAIESGDPVTTASRGGWCNGINLLSHGGGENYVVKADPKMPWYDDETLFDWSSYKPGKIDSGLLIEVVEVDDETTGHETKHKIGLQQIADGLKKLAGSKGYASHFCDIVNDNSDASTADIFLQFVVFGEEKYA